MTPSQSQSGEPIASAPYVFLFYHDADRESGARLATPLGAEEAIQDRSSFTFIEVVVEKDTQQALNTSVANATIAVVVVSAALLGDEFCRSTLLPALVAKADAREMALLLVTLDGVTLPPHLESRIQIDRLCLATSAPAGHPAIARIIARVSELAKKQHAAPLFHHNRLVEMPDGAALLVPVSPPAPPIVAPPPAPAAPPARRAQPARRPHFFYEHLWMFAAIPLALLGGLVCLPDSSTSVHSAMAAAPEVVIAEPPQAPPAAPPIVHSPVDTVASIPPATVDLAPAEELALEPQALPTYHRSVRAARDPAPARERTLRVAVDETIANELCPADVPGMVDHVCAWRYHREVASCLTQDGKTEADCAALAAGPLAICCKQRP